MPRPIGKERVKKPSIKGIIQSIIVYVCCCCGSADGLDIIFCCTHVETPTRIGSQIWNIFSPAGFAKSIHKACVLTGTASLTIGSQPYNLLARPIRDSGVPGII